MVRRLLLVALCFFGAASCHYYRPVAVENGFGGKTVYCHEISRSRCDAGQCGGASMDYVTYQCGNGKPVSRCMANFRCGGK